MLNQVQYYKTMTKDIFGKVLLDYQSGNYTEDLMTWTNISDKDILPLPYLFRNFSEMPKLEQEAPRHPEKTSPT